MIRKIKKNDEKIDPSRHFRKKKMTRNCQLENKYRSNHNETPPQTSSDTKCNICIYIEMHQHACKLIGLHGKM